MLGFATLPPTLAEMKYSRPPWPQDTYKKFSDVAAELGYEKKGSRWKLLDFLLDYARDNKTIFRKR